MRSEIHSIFQKKNGAESVECWRSPKRKMVVTLIMCMNLGQINLIRKLMKEIVL